MQYKALTTEHQRDLLQKRILDYEVVHFQSTCEREIFRAQGNEENVDAVQADLEPLEKALDWCHTLYDTLNAALQAG